MWQPVRDGLGSKYLRISVKYGRKEGDQPSLRCLICRIKGEIDLDFWIGRHAIAEQIKNHSGIT